MATPAKKAAESNKSEESKTQSLADILNKKNDEETREGAVNTEENVNEDGPMGTMKAVSEVVEPGDNVDNQANTNNNDDNIGNPDGVTFSGSNPINKTPADLAAESPEETKRRFRINEEVPDDVHNNPNIQVRNDDGIQQVASGTHLHPDVARDNYNRALSRPSESGAVTRTVTEMVYATEAPVDDKGIKNPQPEELA